MIHGCGPIRLALKARINSQNAFGEALQTAYQRIKSNFEGRGTDLDQDIKVGRDLYGGEDYLFIDFTRHLDCQTTYNSWLVAILHYPVTMSETVFFIVSPERTTIRYYSGSRRYLSRCNRQSSTPTSNPYMGRYPRRRAIRRRTLGGHIRAAIRECPADRHHRTNAQTGMG